jgi:hypothetical protein
MNNQHDPIFFTPPSGDTKRARTLYKGGGGGGGGDGGAAERKAAEDARIAAAITNLNSVFGVGDAAPVKVNKSGFRVKNANGKGFTFDQAGYDAAVLAAKSNSMNPKMAAREALYSKIGDDTKNNAMIDLNKERGLTERDLNFMLARNGLSGGSRDVDANKDVLDTFNQGVLKATNIGLQTGNNARSNDEKTRVNLINSIHAGLSDGDAQQQAYQGMANNAKQAQDDANGASLAGFFDVLKNQQQQAQYLQGMNGTVNQAQKSGSTYGSTIKGNYGGKTGSF